MKQFCLAERKCLNEGVIRQWRGKRGVPMGRAVKVLGGVSSNCYWEVVVPLKLWAQGGESEGHTFPAVRDQS